MLSRERFRSVWRALGLTAAEGLFETLRTRYAEPHRAYHNAQHVEECLTLLDAVRAECERPDAVELALWFHDAIYDPRASGNETRSAEWATHELQSAGARPALVDTVRDLILATRHDATPQTRDAQIVTDIDLAILGTSAERFREYEEQVRREYSWVPGEVFRHERARLLRGFLARRSIYATPFFHHLEKRARVNLTASLARLM